MSFKSVCGKVLTKGTGAVALYLVARDAHLHAKVYSDSYRKTKDALTTQYYLENTMTLSKSSHTIDNLQQGMFSFVTTHNLRGFINATVGYFKGFFGSLVSDVVPLALGLVALLSKGAKEVATGNGNLGLPANGGTIGKRKLGLPAKLSALGLVVLAGFSFIRDGLGIGKNKVQI